MNKKKKLHVQIIDKNIQCAILPTSRTYVHHQ